MDAPRKVGVMAGGVQIRVRDNGYLDRIRAIKSLDGHVKAKVGIQGAEASAVHDKSGATVAEVASIHEFGAKNVPERSFIRSEFDEQKRAINEQLKEEAIEVVAGKQSIYEAMAGFGEWQEEQVKQRIRNRIDPPLSPVTVARKGHDVPLIDTGKLIESITATVVRE
jgi:hypothetical protein